MDGLEITNQKFERKNVLYKEYFMQQENPPNTIEIVLKFKPEARIRVEEYFEESVVKFTADGGMIVSVSFPEDEWVFATILSFGELVEVVGPKHIRERIREKAQIICAVYNADIQLSHS